MLVPEVLVQLGEGEQLKNIHRVYLQEEENVRVDENNKKNLFKSASNHTNAPASKTRVRLGRQK